MGRPWVLSRRIKDLGIELPEPVQPIANYVRWVQTGNLLFISGTGPGDETQRGKLGSTMSVEEGYAAAREVGLQILATAKAALGDLDRVTRVVKVLGMVNCTPDFGDQPQVINGCSDLFVEVFGDAGRHTRSAVGFVALPARSPSRSSARWKSARRSIRCRDTQNALRAFYFGDLSDDEQVPVDARVSSGCARAQGAAKRFAGRRSLPRWPRRDRTAICVRISATMRQSTIRR